jgi:hypothetical protein
VTISDPAPLPKFSTMFPVLLIRPDCLGDPEIGQKAQTVL